MHALTNNFLRAVSQNMPDVPENVMQWWTGHNAELQKVLLPLLKIPMPTVVGTYTPNLGQAGQIGVDLQGNCWVPFPTKSRVGKITPSGIITTIDLGLNQNQGGPQYIDVAPDGSIWVGVFGPGEVFRLDPDTGAVLLRLTVCDCITQLRVDQATGDVWASGREDLKVYRISQNKNVQSYPAGKVPDKIVFGKDGTVWFANWGSCNLTRITPANKASGQSEMIALNGHQYAGYMAVDAVGNVCCSEVGGVTRIDAAGNKKWYNLPSGPYCLGVAVDSKNNFWVASGFTGNAYKIDPDGNLGSPIAIGGAGSGVETTLQADSDDYIWVSFWDGANKRGVGRISPAGVFEGPFVAGCCRYMAFRGDRVWVVNEADPNNSTVIQLTR